MAERIVLHSDLNNCYASIECILHPELKGKYLAVCGSTAERHGIVLAKNQLAKQCGIKTGEVIWQAKQKCPQLVIVPPHMDQYLKFSKLTQAIYNRYTDLIEPFGMDECWLDVTHSLQLFGSGEQIAYQIKERIKREVGLTVSIGVSFNKVFAKLGSDMKKPDAVTVITRENFKQKVWGLPASDLLYVGRATKRKLDKINVKTIGKLASLPDKFLYESFGKHGLVIGKFARGQDDSPVMKYGETTEIKSIGNGNTAARDLTTVTEVKSLIYCMAESVATRLRKHKLNANGVALSIKTHDLETFSLQRKFLSPTACAATLGKYATELFQESFDWSKSVRAITVCACYLSNENAVQLSFMGDFDKERKLCTLEQTVDRLRKKYSHPAILRGIVFCDAQTKQMNPEKDNTVHPVSFFKGGKII